MILRIRSHALTCLTPAAPLQLRPQLTDLWMNDNAIPSLDDVAAGLQAQRDTLTCVYLRGNPCAEEGGAAAYRERMRALLPRLEQLDDAPLAAEPAR